ncbi:DUF2087 domain-containing protein [Arthrobacter pullicola]|nr:DUF2087 domain-containing protein [Arthrobacter pullicola]
MTAGRFPGTDTGADDGGASNRWKALAAALADDRRLRLYGRIISAADSGQPLQRAGLDRTEVKSLTVLQKAGLVTAAEDGALGADPGVFQNLLTGGRQPAVTSPLRLLTPGRAGNLPGRRADRLELLHHLAGAVFSRHGSLGAGTGGTGGDSEAGTSGETGMDGADPAGSPARLTEAEVTSRLAEYSDDPAMVRRAMVDEGIVRRSPDGSRYWLARPRPADGMEFA